MVLVAFDLSTIRENLIGLGHNGAGEGNRTLATGLEGQGSTTELHPRIFFTSLDNFNLLLDDIYKVD